MQNLIVEIFQSGIRVRREDLLEFLLLLPGDGLVAQRTEELIQHFIIFIVLIHFPSPV